MPPPEPPGPPASPGRRAAAGATAALLAAELALVALAIVPSRVGIALAVVVVAALDVALPPAGRWALSAGGLDEVARSALRGLALVAYAFAALPHGIARLTVGVVAVAVLAHAAHAGLVAVTGWLGRPVVIAVGLPLGLGPLPRPLPRWVVRARGWAVLVDVLAVAGLVIATRAQPAPAVVGLLVAAGIAVGPVALVAAYAARLARRHPRQRVPVAVRRELLRYSPEVVLYFGGAAEWRYQVENWLAVAESLGRPAAVLVRDRAAAAALAPTTLPVICAPSGPAVMGLELPSLRAALFVANADTNGHLLRRPGVRKAFIGHGDSDKAASANPMSRVYDEIWVAGGAGRDRYVRAGIGLAPSAVVAVGRPQLPPLPREADGGARLTVLYAPTWEGWGEDPLHSSLATLGVALVRALVTRGDVRVVYRPHPRSGHRDPALRRAHAEVVEVLQAAGATVGAPAGIGPRPGAGVVAHDLLHRAVGEAPAHDRADLQRETDAWDRAYWAGVGASHHVQVGESPDLYATFRRTDALVADVSSVATDFLAADRPYAVVHTGDEPDEVFRAQTPSAAGGFVVGAGLRGLADLLTAASGGTDPTRTARAEARSYLLGPRPADPMQYFRAAVDRLCEGLEE